MAIYTYDIANDTANGSVLPSVLHFEIETAAYASATFDHVNAHGNNLYVFYTGDLDTADKTALDAVVAAHDGGVTIVQNSMYGASEEESMTSSTDYVVKLQLNMTVPIQKDVIINYSAEIGSSSSWCGVGIKVEHIDSTGEIHIPAENQPMIYVLEWDAFSGFAKCVLTPGANTITIYYKTVNLFGTTSAKIRRARLYIEGIK